MKLCVEAVGGAKIEKLYTLLDHHELAPRSSYEVCIGDLHAGDSCHLPILVRLPALSSPASYMDVVRFSLTYVDALKIDTKTCDVCAGIARAEISPKPQALPLDMDRERNRVLVAESLHRAAAAANSGSLDAACTLLADAETQLSASPSMQQHDPLCARLQEVLFAALRRLEETLGECKCRSGASLQEKPSRPQLGSSMRADVRRLSVTRTTPPPPPAPLRAHPLSF
jgi:hypothetical protein